MKFFGRPLKVAAIAASLCLVGVSYNSPLEAEQAKPALDGKKIAFNVKKGNCLACHEIPGGNLAGDVAPALSDMKDRFPDRAALKAQVWDATVANPSSFMPPFGRHGILSEKEIDAIVDFLYTL